MSDHDYDKLGFKCGLEIHQQLSGKKLFCGCPAIIRKDKPDFKFFRFLRASAGETGKVDLAALHESGKGKAFEYYAYNDCTCLVEMDEEPPHNVNSEALETALVMAKLLNMKILDCIQFMRKTVVDGSNVSGFQRTALIAYDGWIEVNNKRVGVESLCLEEESCQAVERSEKKDVYNLSRLGIPLIEVATDASIRSPEECRDVAEHIGMLLRSTGKVMRGIGSIRQDVNISIKGGARTEVKGFQDYKNIPRVIRFEVDRQLKIIKQGKRVEQSVRKAEPDFTTSYQRPMPGADRMYPESDVEVIMPEMKSVEVPETINERKARYMKKYELSEDLAGRALKFEGKNKGYSFKDDFDRFGSEKLPCSVIVSTVLNAWPDAEKKHGKKIDFFSVREELFSALSSGKIAVSSIPEALKSVALTGKLGLGKFGLLSDEELEGIVRKVVSDNKGAPKGLLMGKIMRESRGRADGRKAESILRKHLEKK